jgi:ABC-type bacteriocin/lantibiotic exporter with double-glycine peptidase domain
LIQLILISSSLFAANYLSALIDYGIGNQSIRNLILISLIFFLILILNQLAKLIQQLTLRHNIYLNTLLLSKKLFAKLLIKNRDFILKTNIDRFYLIDSAIQEICQFYGYELVNFCTNLLTCLILMIILTFINP